MSSTSETNFLETLTAYRNEGRPAAWIAREVGLPVRAVSVALADSGTPVRRMGLSLDTYDQIEQLVQDEAPLSEIVRTTGVDHKVVKSWFPSAGLERGSNQHQKVIRMREEFRGMERKYG